jgi:hypothetical protein
LEIDSMHSETRELGETGEEILAFDVSDEALERAAVVTDGRAMTIAYCTNWHECGWPL